MGAVRRAVRLGAAAVVAVVLAVALALGTDLAVDRSRAPAPPPEPAEVEPPPGLDLPELGAPRPVARAVTDVPLRAAAVRGALAPHLDDRDLGNHVLSAVGPLTGGPLVQSRRGRGQVATPASTTKLMTAAAALEVLGPDRTFTTEVVAPSRRRIVLVGGGDPFLASTPADPGTYPARADVVDLARQTAQALRARDVRRVRLAWDDTLFTGPAVNPRWPTGYVPEGVVSPIHALWVDEGRDPVGYGRVADPPATAADTFAVALRAQGLDVRVTGAGAAPDGARTVASVTSAPVAQVVERLLEVSDNEASEVLLRHVGLAVDGEGSFEGGQRGVARTLAALGVDLADPEVLYDGSGLSRENRLRPASLVALLRVAAGGRHPELRAVVTGLPVAGYLGSLADRFGTGDPQALGRVRAKTGTLTGVFALAGVATTPDGTPMVFALMADRIRPRNTLDALEAMDEAAASLGACDCGR